MANDVIIKPQDGYQTMALSSPADIVIGGGAAGVGKTWTLLVDPLRDIQVPDFGGVIFRRITGQITNQGGLWDESSGLYPLFGATPNQTMLSWKFPAGSKMRFSHMQYEKDLSGWQGSQIPFIGFDELTHFTEKMFFYMLSRNRTMCGVTPYVRATCNPDPDSWVANFIEWFINQETGFPIPERQGVVRYFAKDGDSYIWGNTMAECIEKASYFLMPLLKEANAKAKEKKLPPIRIDQFVKSMTFIGGSIYDNQKLLQSNPEYLANLAAQDEQSQLQLLKGNWKVAINPLDVYDYQIFRDYFTNSFVDGGEKTISVDVALDGADKLVIGYFEGERWEDIDIIDLASGKEVIDAILKMQDKHHVPNSRIVYDANGVGRFIGGRNIAFIPGSFAFENNGRAYPMKDGRKFKNLKAQCYIIDGLIRNQYISEKVANTMYDSKMTVRQRLMFERTAIKREILKDDGPLALIRKIEMKEKYLSGKSPDILDMFMQKRVFDLKPKAYVDDNPVYTKEELGLF